MTYEKIVVDVTKALAKKDFSKVGNVALQIDVVGEGEGAFYVAVNDGKVDVKPFEYIDHTAKLIVNADDLMNYVNNGKTDVNFQFERNAEAVSALLDVMKGSAAKKAATPAKKAAAPAKKAAAPAKKAAAPAKKAAAPAKKAAAPAKKAAAKKATK